MCGSYNYSRYNCTLRRGSHCGQARPFTTTPVGFERSVSRMGHRRQLTANFRGGTNIVRHTYQQLKGQKLIPDLTVHFGWKCKLLRKRTERREHTESFPFLTLIYSLPSLLGSTRSQEIPAMVNSEIKSSTGLF
jgi:hypothetical protein